MATDTAILIVEDEGVVSMEIQDRVKSLGFRVAGIVPSGARAVEMAEQHRPDLVLMDITMPKVDGLKGVQMIKEFDRSAKIVMCSAMGQKELVLKAIKAGAKDFIIKPFEEKRVVESVNRVLGIA